MPLCCLLQVVKCARSHRRPSIFFLPLLRSCLAEHHHFAEQGVLDDERCTNRLRSLCPIPERDFTSKLKLVVICSFNVNMPGDDMENFKGGVTDGSILEGMLQVGDKIEVRPVLSARKRKER